MFRREKSKAASGEKSEVVDEKEWVLRHGNAVVFESDPMRIIVLPVVRGLGENRRLVSETVRRFSPAAIGLPVSPDDMPVYIELAENDGEEKTVSSKTSKNMIYTMDGCLDALSAEDEVYLAGLATFGDAHFPPPSYLEAISLAKERHLHLFPLDMDEKTFSDLYVKNVSVFDLWRKTRSLRKLGRVLSRKKAVPDIKKVLGVESPEEFVAWWDSLSTRYSGFRAVEQAREKYMAEAILNHAIEHSPFLAILEMERAEEVLNHIYGRREFSVSTQRIYRPYV